MVVSCESDGVCITIEDNGVGDDLGAAGKEDGQGLKNIRARLAAFDGTLEIESTPGSGYCANLLLPIKVNAKPEDSALADSRL